MKLRKGFLALAVASLALCLSGEIGGGVWLVKSGAPPAARAGPAAMDGDRTLDPGAVARARSLAEARVGPAQLARPGKGIPYLALLDVLLLLTVGFIAASFVLPERAVAPVHALSSLIVALLVLLGSVLGFFAALDLTMAMVSLFLAVPFGTAVYMALWGSFPVGAAAATLGVLLLLKLCYGGCLLLAQPQFLENRGLVLLSLTSLVANALVAFLQGLPPGVLASVADAVAAAAVAVLAAIWAVVVVVWAVTALSRLVAASRLAVT
jgi:hypothetical protein